MKEKQYNEIRNNGEPVPIGSIPILGYDDFYKLVATCLADEHCHCVAYYACPSGEMLKFICCIANDLTSGIWVFSHEQRNAEVELKSLAAEHFPLHVYEREIHEILLGHAEFIALFPVAANL